MANTAAYNGFQQYSGNGSAPTYEQVEVQIAYDATNIFYGDPVKILRDNSSMLPIDGTIVVQDYSWFGPATTGPADALPPYTVGVFMGCSFTNPYTKQKMFSQYYPANTVADDIQAYVVDDPDALFRRDLIERNRRRKAESSKA